MSEAGTTHRQRDGLLATIEMRPPQRARSNALVVGQYDERLSINRRFLHNVVRILIVSPAEKDGLPHLLVIRPFGTRPPANPKLNLPCREIDYVF
jgi:hypothetical protein